MLHKIDNPLERCELKFDGLHKGQFEGYASVFDGNDSYNDTILAGAFADTLKDRKRPVRMFNMHDPRRVIGKWLDLSEDEKGLAVVGEFTPNHTDASNVYASMKHGALDGLSIGFRIPKGGSKEKPGDCDCSDDDWCPHSSGRIIELIDLVEISPVSLQADDAATVSTVKMETITSLKDAEYFLRDSGMFTRSMATAFVSQLKTMCQSDSDAELREQITELQSQLSDFKIARSLDELFDKYSLSKLID